MKKMISLLMAAVIVCSMSGCGSKNNSDVEENNSQKVEDRAKKDAENDKGIENAKENGDNFYENSEGKVQYIGMEKANDGLLDDADKGKNIWIMKYEFTNFTEEPKQLQYMFNVTAYQNGVQLDTSYSYSGKGGEQYKLVGNFFTEVMDGGTVTFGIMVELTDDSEVKVIIKDIKGEGNTKFAVNIGE